MTTFLGQCNALASGPGGLTYGDANRCHHKAARFTGLTRTGMRQRKRFARRALETAPDGAAVKPSTAHRPDFALYSRSALNKTLRTASEAAATETDRERHSLFDEDPLRPPGARGRSRGRFCFTRSAGFRGSEAGPRTRSIKSKRDHRLRAIPQSSHLWMVHRCRARGWARSWATSSCSASGLFESTNPASHSASSAAMSAARQIVERTFGRAAFSM